MVVVVVMMLVFHKRITDRIRAAGQIRNLSVQIGQMKQLAGQLKKKDSALKSIASLEKELLESRKKICVSACSLLQQEHDKTTTTTQ